MSYCLNDFTSIGSNQILKIKLKNKEGFVYGTLGAVSVSKAGTSAPQLHEASEVSTGSLQQFLNYEDCKIDEATVPAFIRCSITSNNIESIAIIDDEVFGN